MQFSKFRASMTISYTHVFVEVEHLQVSFLRIPDESLEIQSSVRRGRTFTQHSLSSIPDLPRSLKRYNRRFVEVEHLQDLYVWFPFVVQLRARSATGRQGRLRAIECLHISVSSSSCIATQKQGVGGVATRFQTQIYLQPTCVYTYIYIYPLLSFPSLSFI